jgi:hypothetical protein
VRIDGGGVIGMGELQLTAEGVHAIVEERERQSCPNR